MTNQPNIQIEENQEVVEYDTTGLYWENKGPLGSNRRHQTKLFNLGNGNFIRAHVKSKPISGARLFVQKEVKNEQGDLVTEGDLKFCDLFKSFDAAQDAITKYIPLFACSFGA